LADIHFLYIIVYWYLFGIIYFYCLRTVNLSWYQSFDIAINLILLLTIILCTFLLCTFFNIMIG